ncbi:MAG: hypothetical protein PHU85_08130 [Phycisphaerae bacterium]|nr:hypothetical protein [Phycisphaerae bacterium]
MLVWALMPGRMIGLPCASSIGLRVRLASLGRSARSPVRNVITADAEMSL